MFERTTLSSGIVVGNFNSQHRYLFDDGTVLPAVPSEVAMSRRFITRENKSYHSDLWDDIELTDMIDEATINDLIFASQHVDVLLVSRRMRAAAEYVAREEDNIILAEKLVTTIRVPHMLDMERKICSSTSFCV